MYIYHNPFFIHLSVDGHLGRSHVLAIVNSEAMNKGIHVSFPILVSSGYMPRRRQLQPTPVLLPGKSHGWRSLVGYSPWSHKESDMTERLHFHFSLSCTGEGNVNPLQYSCLENPRDGSLVGCHLWGHTELDMTDVRVYA